MTDYTNLIERLRKASASWVYPGEMCLEAADALAALMKERDDCIADRTKLRTLLDCKREDIEALQARVKRLEDALRSLLDFEPELCHCGTNECTAVEDAWREARAALAEGDKP